MLILSGQSHPKLAVALATQLSCPLADRSISRFPNQTFKIRLNSDVKGKTVIIIQTLIHPVHDHLIELLLLADAAKSMAATKIIAVIPYLAYSKQDQIFLPGEPLSTRVIAQTLSHTSIDEIITLDLHHDHIAKFFSVPIHNLSFLPTLIDETKRNNLITNKLNELISPTTTVVVAPDSGAVARAQSVADQLRLPLVTIDKHRDRFTGKVKINQRSRFSLNFASFANYIIIDDLIVTGDTLAETAKFLKSRGSRSISVFATHGLFTDGFTKFQSAGINSITISDSIPHKKLPSWVKTISIVPTLKNAIENIIKGWQVSRLKG